MNKYTTAQILAAWDAAYGEDMMVEYPGFFQRLTEENASQAGAPGKSTDRTHNGARAEEEGPVAGQTYALTGARGTKCIANGNSWKDSLVKENN